MLNKKLILLAILLVGLVSLSAISAAEDSAGDIASANDDLILEESISDDLSTSTNEEIELESINDDALTSSNEDSNDNADTLNSADDSKIAEGTAKSYSTLNHMINGNSNDTIYLTENYTYNSSSDSGFSSGIEIKRNLTIYGNGITIDGNDEKRAFFIGKDFETQYTVTIYNITFINGHAGSGGAIYTYGAADYTVINCTFINNIAMNRPGDESASDGGAMFGGTAIDCIFIKNIANSDSGGAIYKGNAIRCEFINNSANDVGGAIYNGNATNCTFYHNYVFYETPYEYGGGALFNGNATNCTFIDNSGYYGGAISRATATNCNFTNNSGKFGGAAYDSNVTNCSFIDNVAFNQGGALYQGNATSCNFTNNTANSRGGAIDVGTAINCRFVENKLNGSYVTYGAAISVCNATNCSFINHSAKNGGAAYESNATDCNFTGNYADTQGGAMQGGKATGCKFINNTVDGLGGAIYKGNAEDCLFEGNLATGTYSLGGAIYQGNATGCNFTNNSAGNQGGAMEGGIATDCRFINNTSYFGGAICNGNSTDCYFINNTANEGGAMNRGNAKNSTFVLNFAPDIWYVDVSSTNCDENCNFIVPEFVVSDLNLPPNDEGKLFFNLTAEGINYDGYNATITLFQNNRIIGTYDALTGDGWDVIGMQIGDYTIQLSLENSNVPPVNITLTIGPVSTSINAENTTTPYNGRGLIVTLKDENGKPVPNVNLTVEIGGNSDKYLTNESGQIEVPITGLKPDTYIAKIEFEGIEYYKPSNGTGKITIEKIDTNFEFTAENLVAHQGNIAKIILKDDYGILYNENIVVTVKDEFGNVLVNAQTISTGQDGIAMVPFIPVRNGTITISASFDGNPSEGMYKPAEGSANFNVANIETKMEIADIENTFVHNSTSITINIADIDDHAVNGTLVLTFNDSTETVSFVINTTGTEFSYLFENTDIAKDVTVTAKFTPAPNSGYEEISKESSFNVAMLNSTITIESGELVAHEASAALITLYYKTPDGIVTTAIPNTAIIVTVKDEYGNVLVDAQSFTTEANGTVSVPFTPMTNGTINITATFEGVEEKYYGNETSINVNVANMGTNLKLTVENTSVHGSTTITIDIADINGNAVNGTVELTFNDTTASETYIIDGDKTQIIYTYENTGMGKDVKVEAKFTPPENSGYEAATDSQEFNVAKFNASIEIEANDIIAHQENTATISLKDANGNIANENVVVTIKDEFGNVLVDAQTVSIGSEGIGTVTFTPITNGTVNITATFDGNPAEGIYNPNETSINANVANIGTELKVSVENTFVNGNTTITIDIADINGNAVNGTVKLTFNDTTAPETYIIDGDKTQIIYTYENTGMGKDVKVEAKFTPPENSGYEAATDSQEFNVAKFNASIEIEANDIIAHQENTATISLKDANGNIANENVVVTIKDEFGNVLVDAQTVSIGSEGIGTVTFTPITNGTVNITATFDGNPAEGIYNPNETSINANVANIGTELKVSVENTFVNGNTTITIDIADINGNAVNGTVKLTFNDTTAPETYIIDGDKTQITYTFKNTDMTKDVKVEAKFTPPENSGYEAITDSKVFNVAKLNTSIVISVEDVIAHQENTVTLTLYYLSPEGTIGGPIANEKIRILILGSSLSDIVYSGENTTDDEGKITVAFTTESKKTLTLIANFAGTEDKYNEVTKDTQIEVDNMKTSISISVENTIVNQNTNIIVSIKDANNNAVESGQLSLNFSDGTHNYVITLDGSETVYTMEFDNVLTNKIVGVTATYQPSEKNGYENSSANTEFRVDKLPSIITVDDLTTTVNSEDYLIISLKNKENESISNANISVELNGNATYTTDSNGEIKVPTKDLAAGTYTAVIRFAGNEVYNESSAVANVTVKKISTKLNATKVTTTYNVNKTLVVTLKDINGNPISGVKVSIKLAKTKKYTTDKNGQVKVNVAKLVPKTYTAKISFAGNDIYLGSTANAKVVVKKAKPKITAKKKTFKVKTKVKKYTITFKNNVGKVLKNKKLTLKVKGKTYKAKTNKKGKATFKIKNLKKKGKYTAVIKFKGDKYYKKTTKKVKLTVKKPKKSSFKTIARGSKKTATVKKIQRALKRNGFYIKYNERNLLVDGIYHQYTEMAVKEFQGAKGLKVTGKVDQKTAKKLKII